jgi:AraC-like DNA-binding protein
LGKQGRLLVEMTENAGCASEKIHLLQQFLLRQLSLHQEDRVFEYCVEKITASKGKVTIKELEKKTGYSSRWLNMKFDERLGVSPKNLSSIIRFKEYYKIFIDPQKDSRSRKDYYELYYDQSHFIKDFKRFTGLAPTRFEKQMNEFGERYYT